jgi:serine/threonine-protein kinase
MIQGRVDQLEELGKRALYEHGTLRDVLARAREGRADIARQMDELNDGAEGVRKEVQPLRIAAQRHAERCVDYPATVQELHREVMRWEGRSAFAEPYLELAAAYRSLADVMEKWHGIRSAQIACEEQSADKEDTLRDVETKLDELREGLRIHESNLAAEVASCEQTLAKLGREADQLEFELLDLASRFSAPLRSKPELGGCFRELTQVT